MTERAALGYLYWPLAMAMLVTMANAERYLSVIWGWL
jgi:hypothetical protein